MKEDKFISSTNSILKVLFFIVFVLLASIGFLVFIGDLTGRFHFVFDDDSRYGVCLGQLHNRDLKIERCQANLNRSMSQTMLCESVLDYCVIGEINQECYKNIMEAR